MADDIDQVLCDNIEKPKKGENNMGMFEQHNPKDLMAATTKLNQNRAGKGKFMGMRIHKFGFPGTV